MITYTKNEPVNRSPYYTCLIGRKVIGTLEQEVDGFYYFYMKQYTPGFWDGKVLKDLAMKLEALNQARNNHIYEYFESQKLIPQTPIMD